MILKPLKNSIHCKILDWFLDYKFKKKFRLTHFHYQNEPLEINHFTSTKNSVLLIGNHSTWWDGFVGWQLNRLYIKKDYYVMMLESTLKNLPFFRRVGAFSINSSSKSVIESLDFSAQLLNDRKNLVQFFPQGQLNSIYESRFEFNKGLEIILKKNASTDIIFYAMFVEYGAFEKPYLNVFIDKVDHANGYKLLELQDWYQKFYHQCRDKHTIQFLKDNT